MACCKIFRLFGWDFAWSGRRIGGRLGGQCWRWAPIDWRQPLLTWAAGRPASGDLPSYHFASIWVNWSFWQNFGKRFKGVCALLFCTFQRASHCSSSPSSPRSWKKQNAILLWKLSLKESLDFAIYFMMGWGGGLSDFTCFILPPQKIGKLRVQ